jgi:alkanesulfonate monooxygenase SsuD/methylene tetrahydromethanopterin reductase-like flavin-dependent oxidoreductase (luciferase family)
MTVDELLETVVLADELGYESAHLIESYADVFGFLGACAAQTRRITLATGVTTVFTRSPATIAIGAITVDNLSGGRFELGLGVGHPEIHARRDDLEPRRRLAFEEPLERMREATELIRVIVDAAARGVPATYRGSHFSMSDFEPWVHAERDRIPIGYGSMLAPSVELAGELADDVLPIYLPAEAVPTLLAQVERGAERAGRPITEITISCLIPCCVSDDEARAEATMRRLLATYIGAYRYYRLHFEALGYGECAEGVKRAIDAGETERAASMVESELVHAVTVFGPPERCRERLDAYRAAGVERPVVYPVHAEFGSYLPDAAAREGIRAAVAALAPAPQTRAG